MDAAPILASVVSLVVVTGYVSLAWLLGRTAPYPDDPSVLLGEPPPEMTAATAVILEKRPTGDAFMAALLDLASRDEIRFHDEGPADGHPAVGIEIRGGDTSDARIILNRRRPIGEAEAFLLTQLKEASLLANRAGDPAVALSSALQGLLQLSAFATSPDTLADSPTERSRREHGLLAEQGSDPAEPVGRLENRLGHPLSPAAHNEFLAIGALTQALSRPGLQAGTESPPAVPQPADPAAGSAPGVEAAISGVTGLKAAPNYIAASAAVHLGAPLFFRTVAETYARRHGWIGGFSFVSRWRWRATAVLELVIAVLVYAAGGGSLGGVSGGLAIGVATGGLITYLVAPLMTRSTVAGALIIAQLAAYRRTLEATLRGAPSLSEVGSGSGLRWLETPDQTIVWAFALGLRHDLEALLGRVGQTTPRDTTSMANRLFWYRPPDAGPGQTPDARSMFAGIEAIGSEPRSMTEIGRA
ncbi:MAG: hypothetical protein ACHQ01_10675 [Candidatus Limnocylindrales bacterium]